MKCETVTASYFEGGIPYDFMLSFLGEKLGKGISREVFICRFDTTLVCKIEFGSREWGNVNEYELWNNAPEWARQWLAPVRYISPYGHVLIQQRATPWMGPPPKKVPAFLADLKADNWGTIDGRPVAFDYGRHRLFAQGLERKRLVKPDWVE